MGSTVSRWYAGKWRTELGIAAYVARQRARNRRRVGTHATDFVGYAPTPEQAAALNEERRAFADAQKGRTD
jgi:hypothetical protein